MSRAIVSPQVGGLNLRIAPGLKAEVIGGALPGDVVEVLTRLQSGWAYVTYKGQTGYMDGKHLNDLKEVQQPAPAPPPVDKDPPAWMFVAGIAAIALAFIAAIVVLLQ